MNFAELLQKYNLLIKENQKLQCEINELREQLKIVKHPDKTELTVADPETGQLSLLVDARGTP
ncbi:MAG: hypothetical protein M1609_16785 [Firmicutes bacterium]|nr:hypothetical protein [Bacillota bacterium]